MVKVTKSSNEYTFEVNGWHKLWAFKSSIVIPAEHIVRAYKDENYSMSFWNLRVPGTYLPGVITAGTYIGKEGIIFCDYTNKKNLLTVELKDEHYSKLVVEVENIEATLRLFS